jgi:C-terminal processing protease CtpA/Prc
MCVEQGGIGVIFTPAPYKVVQLVSGGAAERSGDIRVGDSLLEVDGQSAENAPLRELAKMIRGKIGTPVSHALPLFAT